MNIERTSFIALSVFSFALGFFLCEKSTSEVAFDKVSELHVAASEFPHETKLDDEVICNTTKLKSEKEKIQTLTKKLPRQLDKARLTSFNGGGDDVISLSKKVDLVVKILSNQEIENIIYSNNILDKGALENVQDIKSFASKLSKILTNEEIDSEIFVSQILFTTDFSEMSSLIYQNVFSAITPSIYAVFETSSASVENIVVKWLRNEDNKIIYFNNLKINGYDQKHFVKLSSSKDWEAGGYTVTIYELNDLLLPLATGNFAIYDSNRL